MIPASTSFTETTGLTVYAQRRVVAVLAATFTGDVRRAPPLKKVFCQTTHRHVLMACDVCAESMLRAADAEGTRCKMTPRCDGTYMKEVALEKAGELSSSGDEEVCTFCKIPSSFPLVDAGGTAGICQGCLGVVRSAPHDAPIGTAEALLEERCRLARIAREAS